MPDYSDADLKNMAKQDKEKKKIDEMEQQRILIEKVMGQRRKRPFWESFKDAVGVFFLGCCFLLLIATIIFLAVGLIENPVSLTIICATAFLFFVWGNR